jgi:hypothetical protein
VGLAEAAVVVALVPAAIFAVATAPTLAAAFGSA